MKLRAILCVLFGHQPYDYKFEHINKTTEFSECARCHARKNLTGQGWLHPAKKQDDNE